MNCDMSLAIEHRQMHRKIEQINLLKSKIAQYCGGKSLKICIFCAGVYGRIVYQELNSRLLPVEFVVDNNDSNWGDLRIQPDWGLLLLNGSLRCVSFDSLLEEKEEFFVIVANKSPDPIVKILKDHDFKYVMTKRQLDTILMDVPKLDFEFQEALKQLDYSSLEFKTIIQAFNYEIRKVCNYYESKLSSDICQVDKGTPLVSVIMPIYNAEKYVRIAIDSILNQTYSNLELILIDDCPTDTTMHIVNNINDVRIRIIHNSENKGIAYSRNQGLNNSRGKYIAIMDDDDVSMPQRLEKQIAFLEANEDIDILGARHEIINSKGELIKPSYAALYNPNYIKAMYLFRNVYANSTIMLRKDVLDKYKFQFMDNCLGMEDFRFWIECSKVCKMTAIDDVVLQYRECLENESSRILNSEIAEKRKSLYAEFQKYSLEKSGFLLSERQLNCLTNVMGEFNVSCNTLEELNEFYNALQEMIRQAEEKNFDNKQEIRILCKKLFIEKWNFFNVNNLWER